MVRFEKAYKHDEDRLIDINSLSEFRHEISLASLENIRLSRIAYNMALYSRNAFTISILKTICKEAKNDRLCPDEIYESEKRSGKEDKKMDNRVWMHHWIEKVYKEFRSPGKTISDECCFLSKIFLPLNNHLLLTETLKSMYKMDHSQEMNLFLNSINEVAENGDLLNFCKRFSKLKSDIRILGALGIRKPRIMKFLITIHPSLQELDNNVVKAFEIEGSLHSLAQEIVGLVRKGKKRQLFSRLSSLKKENCFGTLLKFSASVCLLLGKLSLFKGVIVKLHPDTQSFSDFFHWAIVSGSVEVIEGLLELLPFETHFDINREDSDGFTPFTLAILTKNPILISYLLKNYDPDIKNTDAFGLSAVDYANALCMPRLFSF